MDEQTVGRGSGRVTIGQTDGLMDGLIHIDSLPSLRFISLLRNYSSGVGPSRLFTAPPEPPRRIRSGARIFRTSFRLLDSNVRATTQGVGIARCDATHAPELCTTAIFNPLEFPSG